jgi:hypothetical protein
MPFEKSFLVWILNTYDINSNIISICFDYILLLRVLVDVFGDSNERVPNGFSINNVDYIKKLFTTFVICNIPFKKEHLDIIQICSDNEILCSFFDRFIYFLFEEHIEPMIITTKYLQVNNNKIYTIDKRNPDSKIKKKWKKILYSFICSKYSLCNIELKHILILLII